MAINVKELVSIDNWKELSRSERYEILKKVTGNSKIARQGRDWTKYSTVAKKLPDYFSSYEKQLDDRVDKALFIKRKSPISTPIYVPIKESAKDRYKRQRKIARERGYTTDEINKIYTKKSDDFNILVNSNRVIDRDSRILQWRKWSLASNEYHNELKKSRPNRRKLASIKKRMFPDWVVYEAQRINTARKGGKLDENARYGFNAVYMFYTEGGTLEFWEKAYATSVLDGDFYERLTGG